MYDEKLKCAVCGSDNLSYCGPNQYGSEIIYDWDCECGSSGKESYEMVFTGHFHVIDSKGNDLGY